jgi:hypothetical protein
MRRAMAGLAAVALAVGVSLLGAGAASAETLNASPCEEIDYYITNGTTIVFAYGPDCPYGGYVIEGGSPNVKVARDNGSGFIWHQEVGRASGDATCEEGWTPAWGQWMNDGTGGFTCARDVVWANGGPGGPVMLYVTVTTADDFVDVDPEDWDQWVKGCNWDPQDSIDDDYLVGGNCPF